MSAQSPPEPPARVASPPRSYPVLTLPAEITGHIFHHYLPEYPAAPPPAGRGSPTLLSHVCRAWRALALSTCALWRAIPLPRDRKAGWMPAWLARSDLVWDFVWVDVMREHARLDVLSCAVGGFQLEDGPAWPVLRHLELRIVADSPEDMAASPSIDASSPRINAPLLSSAILWSFRYSPRLLPWHQLMFIALIGQDPHRCTQVIQQTPNLVYCELSSSLSVSDVAQPDISLPHLQRLILTVYGAVSSGGAPSVNYLHSFVVPALRRLTVDEALLRVGSGSRAGQINALVDKSGCTLDELCIIDRREDGASLELEDGPWSESIRHVSLDLDRTTHNWNHANKAGGEIADVARRAIYGHLRLS
ncbi:F-box domain-containing protein [Mycena indigotica]|uniref:F-box domain-containing protein n=1 Tax=Mycena indigotica TaxID=2126181 RepID=A0A8H6S2G9_9AGAR|nr:F-box domain-containing protein [Mycena indigotica]KAF7290637.1 F-box domain-containing protein [Mycena indigotica]